MRILQYKMITKLKLFPMQDDHENGMIGGVLRPDANTHAERGRTHTRGDQGVLEGQRGDQLRRPEPKGGIRVDSGHPGGAGVHATKQEATGSDSSLGGKDDGAEQRASDPVGADVQRHRAGGGKSLPAPGVSTEIQRARHRSASRGRPGTRMLKRAGDETHFGTRACRVRQSRVCPPSPNLGGTSVQSASQRSLSTTSRAIPIHQADSSEHRRAEAAGGRRDGQGTCGWTRCIKETGMAPKGSITSMQ